MAFIDTLKPHEFANGVYNHYLFTDQIDVIAWDRTTNVLMEKNYKFMSNIYACQYNFQVNNKTQIKQHNKIQIITPTPPPAPNPRDSGAKGMAILGGWTVTLLLTLEKDFFFKYQLKKKPTSTPVQP